MVPTRPPRSQLGLLARCQAPALAGAMHLPTPPHAGASTPGRGPDDLIVACWNVGMPEKHSFTKNLEKAMEDVRIAIADMVSWDIDIIGLNEVHPEFHSLYERTITSAFATSLWQPGSPPVAAPTKDRTFREGRRAATPGSCKP